MILDNKQVAGADGKTTSEALSDKELERYTSLVREAVGFDEKRGDRVEVINASFSTPATGEPAAEEPWYANPMIRQAGRQVAAVLAVLLLAVVVLRPIMKTLLAPPRGGLARADGGGGGDLARDRVTLTGGGGAGGAPGLPNYEQHVAAARSMISQDPKRAAQVVKEWVTADG